MLVVLERVPRASPLEAVLGEEAVAEVTLDAFSDAKIVIK